MKNSSITSYENKRKRYERDELADRANLSVEEYRFFNEGFNWLNGDLFDGQLDSCLITLNNRSKRSRGFHHHK